MPATFSAVRLALVATTVLALLALPSHPGLRTAAEPAPPFQLAAALRSAAPAVPDLGLSSSPETIGWMTGSQVPWKYRYQYLAGGVGTGHGWETWNSPAGEFASLYIDASRSAGYTPVLTYYELLQSTTSSGSEADRDLGALNDPVLMGAYYQNFKLLMQRSGASSGQVVVHVEPDLWAYLQVRASGGGPAAVPASVSSSGVAELAGLPNNAQGFAGALLHLRDLYAPGVSLAAHASMWASGIDVATNTSSSLSAGAEAAKTAAFLSATGHWDAIFQDVDDHDAGWWDQQGTNNAGFTHWWDPANLAFPNFTRYLEWSSRLHSDTGLPQVVWQVPLGNQVYLTMNNTCGHYQDNVAQYFLGHPGDLAAAGIVAVLFGSGNACQTTNTDAAADGISNGGGSPTSSFGCAGCNTQPSTVSDDDGGFLRVAGARYYASAQPPPATQPKVFSGGLFNATQPRRVLDTRTGVGHQGSIGPAQTISLDLSPWVPAGATAVTLNVTAAAPPGSGFVTVWPAGEPQPLASNLNYSPGQTVANLVQVPLGFGTKLSIYNSAGATDVVADLNGYSAPTGAGYVALAPARIFDTRASHQTLGAGQTVNISALPTGATSVVLNVTATNPGASSYLTVYPSGQDRPLASNLNFVAGQTISNRTTVQVGAGGVSVYNLAGTVDVVVDLNGYYSGGQGTTFVGVTPTRILDTRTQAQPIGAGGVLKTQVVGGAAGVPAGARAVVLNLTPASPRGPGFLTLWQDGLLMPTASDLNLTAGLITPNLVLVAVGADGSVQIFNQQGSNDVVVDLLGWYI